MSPDENKAAIHRWFEEGLNRGLDVALAMAGEYLGDVEAAARAMLAIYTAFPDSHYTIEDLVAEGDRVVVRWTSRGTHRGPFRGVAPTGRRVGVTGISIYRMAGGKIVDEWAVADTLGLLEQLGAPLAPLPTAYPAPERDAR